MGHPRITKEECTRDPIYLFQRRRFAYPNEACEKLDDLIDEMDWFRCDEGLIYRGRGDDAERVTDLELVERGYGVEYWDTELVFFSRGEAEEYGNRRSYNYTDGWRVYSVCAEGELIQMLKDADKRRESCPES